MHTRHGGRVLSMIPIEVMHRPNRDEYHSGYQKYFDLVLEEDDYLNILRRNTAEAVESFERISPEKHDFSYAPGKWTIKEILMHLIDTERVFAVRALAAARGDESTFYRMDEELYARSVDLSKRSLASLIAEFKTVRAGSVSLLENITEEQSRRWCNVVTHPMSVRAIAFFLIAHIRHHLAVIRERY